MLKSFVFIFFLFTQLALAKDNQILIGGKVFTEQNILVDILRLYLESKSYAVRTNKNLGGTFVAYEALKQGSLDIYIEYSGTAYHMIFKQNKVLDEQSTSNWLKQAFLADDIILVSDLGFSNSYSLVVDQNLKAQTISDLKSFNKTLRIGFEHEVLSRPDGIKNLIGFYELEFKSIKTMNVGLMYQALKSKQIDVGFGYTTDGRNIDYNLKTLKDDLHFFPKYKASILVREQLIKDHKNLMTDLNQLTNTISNEDMTRMNFEVDVKKRSSLAVAEDFLIQKQLLPQLKLQNQISFLGFKIEELQMLKTKFTEHLQICGIGFIITLFFGFLFGILAYEFKRIRPLVFAFINVFQTVPSLALLGFLIPFLGIGFLPSLVALVIYSLLPLVHNVFIGLDQVELEIIESCRAIGMNELQILTQVRIPIAMPTIGAGLRSSTVLLISTATVAAFIGAGGLGELIFQGISSMNHRLILLGAIPAAALAFVADFLVLKVSLFLTSEGLRKN